ncbi:MAG: ATP-binding protein, partial [Casimicrobium sp.]
DDRPWYTQAKAANRLTWTPVYVSFASNALVTTASQPVVTREAKLLGVLAADVELSELSAFMKNVSVSENGVAFIVDRDGLLVASSAPGDPFKQDGSAQTRVKARDHGDEVERAAADWWQQIRSEAIPSGAALRSAKINSDKGDSIDVAVRRVSRIDGVDWDVVVAIPRSDLTAPIVRSATIMFVVIFAALIAALQLGLWIVNRVTGDVDQLVKSANNYTIDGNQYVEPKTTLQETSVLSGAFVGMFRRLRDSLSTIRKQNEDLAALNTTLEERVERRTRQLENKNFELTAEVSRREQLENELREASEAATKQADDKVRFMAMLSHELRTPLQAVIGTSEILSHTLPTGSDASATLRAASKSVLALVDGVLSYAKLEAGKVEPVLLNFPLRVAIDEAVRVSCTANNVPRELVMVSIAPTLSEWIHTDVGIFRQLLINLVTNAMKHAPGKRIVIRAAREGESGLPEFGLNISVIDEGAGIPSEARHRLFQPFQQIGRGSADPSRGSGLGLAICALLVKSLDGNIGVVDSPRAGTEIAFSIPVREMTHGGGKSSASKVITSL